MRNTFGFIFGFISGVLLTLVLVSSARADECPLSEGLVCGEWDYTGGRTPDQVIHHPLVSGNVTVPNATFEETMQAFMIIMMAKALEDMDKEKESCE